MREEKIEMRKVWRKPDKFYAGTNKPLFYLYLMV